MVNISDHAANACIYTSYAVVTIVGLVCAWWGHNKGQYLSGNGTRSAVPLTLNFIASGLGVGAFATYPQIAAQSGLHGMFVYALSSAVPFLLFGFLGPIIRRQMPKAFVLTEWIRYRYGPIACIVVSCCTVLTIFLFMVSELASLKAAVETMTGVPGLPVLIVEAILVSIYTAFGGFYVSFLTDSFQVTLFLTLLAVCIIGVGCNSHVDKEIVKSSGLLKQNKLGWKLIYILVMAIVTNDCFMSGFWMRTFAAKTKRDMYISTCFTAVAIFCLLSVVAVPGLLAVWSGALDPNSETFGDDSANALYIYFATLPPWLTGFFLVFSVMISSCTFDSLQCAIVSTVSNDFFRNRVRAIWVRVLILAVMAPIIVVAIKAVNVLNIYLIVDVLSSAVVPVLFLGLSKRFYFLTGFEIITSITGGILGVFIFGTIYYKNADDGAGLLIMENGIYGDDWGAFGAFVAAPVCCIIGAIVGILVRGVYLAFAKKRVFAVFAKPENGASFHKPIDTDWLTLPKPWFEYMPASTQNFSRKLDYYIFNQGEEDGVFYLMKLPKPWYEYAPKFAYNYLNWAKYGPIIDSYIFKPEEMFDDRMWYERLHLGKFGKFIDYIFNGDPDAPTDMKIEEDASTSSFEDVKEPVTVRSRSSGESD